MQNYLYLLATDRVNGIIPKVFKIILFLLSFVYRFGLETILFCYRIRLFKTHRLSCKVISIGNITWGGTGKTPLVEFLATYLRDSRHKPAILSRGYKRIFKTKLQEQRIDYRYMGDEPFMLSANLVDIPVIVDKNRIDAAKEAMINHTVDTIILDDGFQHWRLHRDLNIVTIDATNPFGNYHLIPRGILREPLQALKRADIFVLTKVDLVEAKSIWIKQSLTNINPSALIVEAIYQPMYFYNIQLGRQQSQIPLAQIKERDACLISSLADPISFEKTIANLDINVALRFSFIDHHIYRDKDIGLILDSCKKNHVNIIVTTEKDAVKLKEHCRALSTCSILALRIQLKIVKNEKEFFNRLSTLYHG